MCLAPVSSTSTRGLRSSSGPNFAAQHWVRWLQRSSLRQSAAEYHLPRSSSATLQAGAGEFLGHHAAARARSHNHRIHVFESHGSPGLRLVFVLLPAADRRVRQPEHFPTRHVAIAAVARVAVESLPGVGENQLEE